MKEHKNNIFKKGIWVIYKASLITNYLAMLKDSEHNCNSSK